MELAEYTDCNIEGLKAKVGFDVSLKDHPHREGTIVKIDGQAAHIHMHDSGDQELLFGRELRWV